MDNPPPPANTNIDTIVKAQIVFLLSTLTEDNFERHQASIRQLSEQQGIDTYLHFIRRLIVQCQGRLIQGPNHPHVPHSGTSAHDPGAALTFRLLVHETQRLARDPFLADRLRDALDRGEGEVFRTFDVNRFVDRLGLRPTERLVLASALVKAGRKELAMQALAMVRADFEPAVLGLCQTPTFDGVDLPLAGVAKLMGNLLTDLPSEMPIIDAAQRQALILAVQSKYGSDAVVPVLTRILPALTLLPGASLVPTLAQMGPELTGHIEIVLSLFLRFGISDVTPPPESLVLDIVSALGRLAMEGTLMCDANVIIQALASLNPNISWPDLIRTLDLPEKRGVDTATLKLIIAILAACPRDAEPHAVHGLWGEWNNQLYQLKLLDTLLLLPPDTFSFINLPGRRIVTVDNVAVASPTIKSLAANVQGHSWNSLDLYDVLCLAAANPSVEVRSYVKDMLDKVIKLCPELVHLGLLQANAPSSALRSDYAQKLLGMFFARHQNHQLVFMRIWQLQPSYLFSAFREFYDDKNSNIARVLDIAQDLKILDSLLEMHPWTFALDLASLASRREYLNLEKWLQDSVDKHGLEFLDSVIQFLRTKMEAESERMHDPPTESSTISLTPAHVAIFLRLLKTHMDELTPEEQEYSLTTRTVCLQVYPRLMSFAPNSGDAGLNVITYPQDIENEVESIYRQMFDGTISLDAVLGLLQHRHGSMHQREIDLFACSLHFLFDEYRFFNTYPPAELEMTGRLFGSIIQLGFIDGVPLGIALRYVCEALARAENSPLFNFGYAAITQFENRLPEWPPVCQRLIRIPHLQEHWPDFVNTLRRAIAASDVVASAAARASEPFASIQPDPITEDIEHPPEDLSDKILFVINNLAPSNFDAKLSDMQQHFEDRYSRWLARYLVDQRVSTEPNNHALYLRFLDALDRRPLFRYILQETLVKSANLLNADSTLASSSERAVLKNIAVWLGTITLARDRPIRHNNLSFKDLLLEAADNSRLILAIPFVCKTLEPCAKSNVFKPPNPWLMAVLGVLAELYHFAELKLNLKFEIEVLCKSLDIMLDSIEPSMLFRERPTTNAATLMEEYADLPPLPSTSSVVPNYDISGGALIGAVDGGNGVLSRLGQGLGAPTSPGESQRAVDDHIESILAALGQSVRVPRDFYEASSHNPSLKRAVQVAVDRAVREIIVPVVERSVTIAGISTRELAAKDFATEPSEEKLKKAAQMMSQKLAGSLALVTCKDPLKANLSTHMRQALMEHGYNDNIPQQAVDMFVTENLEIACSAIEKAAMERAVMDVDETLAMSFENRRGHREQQHRGMHPFWDQTVMQTSWPSTLPDPLRLKATGVQPHQLMLYEDFGVDASRRLLSRPGSTVSYSRLETSSSTAYSPAPDHQAYAAGPSFEDVMNRFAYLNRELEAVVMQLPVVSLAALPGNHEVRRIIREVAALATTGDRQRVPLGLSQKITQLLYKTQVPLARELYAALLHQFCKDHDEVAKEVIPWLVESPDERKYNVPVTIVLLKAGLFLVEQQDAQLALFLGTDPKPSLQNYAAGLVRECVFGNPPTAIQKHFSRTIDMFMRLSASARATEDVDHVLDELRGVRRPAAQVSEQLAVVRQPSTKPEQEIMREKLAMWFQQWIQIFTRAPSLQQHSGRFVTGLQKHGIIDNLDTSSMFFRVCTETSVNAYLSFMAAGEYKHVYQALDAMARLVIFILKFNSIPGAPDDENNKLKSNYLERVLSVVVLVLANMHEESGMGFQQRPFSRFFSSLFNDLHTFNAEGSFRSAYPSLLRTLGDSLATLQPYHFPGFSFAWMSLITHRRFMPKLLAERQGWETYHKLLLMLLQFMAPLLEAASFSVGALDMFNATQRTLLVILHDFPEFLSEYYFSLCDAIPVRCVQMRNIILSAFPSNVTLPDTASPVDGVADYTAIPPIIPDFSLMLRQSEILPIVDQMLSKRAPLSSLELIKEKLFVGRGDSSSQSVEDISYDLHMMDSLVLYIGALSVAQAKTKPDGPTFNSNDAGVVVLEQLAKELDYEGQRRLVSSLAVHLRYPNAHTFWFRDLFLHLFLSIQDEQFADIATTVLLERVLVHRPHPWGVIATFTELVRNPKYGFNTHPLHNKSPEVGLLLKNVTNGILQS